MTNQQVPLDSCLDSTATQWGSSRWAELARCPVAHSLRYEPGRFRLPITLEQPPADPVAYPDSAVDPGAIAAAVLAADTAADVGRLDACEVGTLVHACLAWMAHGELDGADHDWHDVIDRARDTFDPRAISEAHRLMVKYSDAWPAWWHNYTALGSARVRAVEQYVELTAFARPWTTKADLVLEIDGQIWFVDHKTRARLPNGTSGDVGAAAAAIRQEARVRPQFLGTALAVQSRYALPYVPRMIVNVLVKTVKPEFLRVPVKFERHQLDVWQWQQGELAILADLPPRPHLHECHNYFGRLCWAYEICHGR